MTTADQLRNALEEAADVLIASTGLMVDQHSSIFVTADKWLRILEGDAQIVETLAVAMHDAREATRDKPAHWIEQSEVTRNYYRRMVRAVIAAIAGDDE